MTWLLFALVWSIGGLFFAATAAADYMENHTDDEITRPALATLIAASGPLVWEAMIYLALRGEE